MVRLWVKNLATLKSVLQTGLITWRQVEIAFIKCLSSLLKGPLMILAMSTKEVSQSGVPLKLSTTRKAKPVLYWVALYGPQCRTLASFRTTPAATVQCLRRRSTGATSACSNYSSVISSWKELRWPISLLLMVARSVLLNIKRRFSSPMGTTLVSLMSSGTSTALSSKPLKMNESCQIELASGLRWPCNTNSAALPPVSPVKRGGTSQLKDASQVNSTAQNSGSTSTRQENVIQAEILTY